MQGRPPPFLSPLGKRINVLELMIFKQSDQELHLLFELIHRMLIPAPIKVYSTWHVTGRQRWKVILIPRESAGVK